MITDGDVFGKDDLHVLMKRSVCQIAVMVKCVDLLFLRRLQDVSSISTSAIDRRLKTIDKWALGDALP